MITIFIIPYDHILYQNLTTPQTLVSGPTKSTVRQPSHPY